MKNKGCVVEVRNKTLILMTASCDFVEIPKSSMGLVKPGMEVFYETRPRGFAVHKKWMAVAAMFMVLIMGSLLMLPPTNAMPVYMASIDINPSMNMFINETGHVVEIRPLNTEAEKLEVNNLEGETIEEAVSSLMGQLFDQGYFADQREHYMVFSLTAIDSTVPVTGVSAMILRLENTIHEEKQLRKIDLEVLSFAAMKAEVEEAESREVSLNQLLVRNQYQAMMREQSPETDDQQNESMETMVRTILKEKQHPVFEEHPGADPGRNNVKKEDVQPQKMKNDDTSQPSEQQREHPVFDEHPGNNDKGNDRANRHGNQLESQGNNNGIGN